MENNTEVVELLKKQVRATYIRNAILLIFVVIVAVFSMFMVKNVNEAMLTVQHIDELTYEISSDLEELDIDNLNSTIENLDSITEELDTSMKNFEEASEAFSKMFRFK